MRDTYHHGDLKKQLILVGIDIINQEGLEGLSLRKAAERCGVSHGAPYSHFKNKEEYLKNINAFVENAFSEALMEAEMNNNGDEKGRMARMTPELMLDFFASIHLSTAFTQSMRNSELIFMKPLLIVSVRSPFIFLKMRQSNF